MVVMVHNSDVPDGWEREAEDPSTSSASHQTPMLSVSTSPALFDDALTRRNDHSRPRWRSVTTGG